ncbi:uncharacterized protein LOC130579408 isoform X2 [Malurus melanocephalus]|uniref:uncharacterized protein LOC130579408 isoform X2 n=1 Tax=Malurus melanocephalus TaxID=175006 RepID=UPI0025478CB4|nr:uncharacterized protein LOC130579408 isoform X2 [Malurus melanocephalus]XP_057232172.1 uncharacterized protein LOC130579408 isoform X2 [Malurus melanocephalus]
MPFLLLRCDNYRLGWKDYWYMGPKCNHLWNTLDFILVTTIPEVVLIIIVVTLFSFFYCLQREKAGKQPKPPSREAQHNPAFSADTGLGHRHQQPPGDAWVGQIPKVVLKRQDFDDASIPNQRQNYSPVYAQPLRRADPAPDYFPHSQAQREQFEYPRKDLPYPVYPDARQYQRY